MCRCRDTGAKRCRWLFSTPEPWGQFLREQTKKDRREAKQALAREDWLEEAA